MYTSNLFHIGLQEAVADQLRSLTGMEKTFFCNSGAEANEAAIKLARRLRTLQRHHLAANDRAGECLSWAHAGRSLPRAIQKYVQGFGSTVEGFLHVPPNDLSTIDALAAEREDIVAVMVEPIMGEGGIRPLDTDYLAGCATVVHENEWLLILDEVQTGNSRCGSTYVFEQLDVTPMFVDGQRSWQWFADRRLYG